MKLNIVMVEPQIPQNTGNIARTCAVTGARLHLVGPMGFRINDAKLKRAGLDYWHLLDITYYEDIKEFWGSVMGDDYLKDQRADNRDGQSAANAAPDTSEYNFYYFTTKARRIYTEPHYEDGSYIFFGSETKGLDEALLYKNPEQCVRFPMLTGLRSLNLSNAVAVGVYEVLRQWDFPDLQHFGKMNEGNKSK